MEPDTGRQSAAGSPFKVNNQIMPEISERACVAAGAQIADTVKIGPHCYVGPESRIGPGCVLHNNVTVIGKTTVGANNVFFQNAVVGGIPQDLKYKGEQTELSIGSDNVFRENVTVHLGTELGGGKTIIGNENLFMAGVHIAHDCRIADRVIIANNALIAGHVTLELLAIIGGGAGLHHFVTIGQYAMVGGLTRVVADVPPFMIFEGNPGAIRAVNTIGLARNGFSDEQIDTLKDAYRKLFRRRQAIPTLDELEETNGDDANVQYLVDFMRRSLRGRYGRFLESTRADRVANDAADGESEE